MRKKIQRFMTIALTLFVLIAGCITAEASESTVEDNYYIINGELKVPMNQNYYNPDTGEYFIWDDSANETVGSRDSNAKYFTFKIRHSVTSGKFTISSSTVRVDSFATVVDGADEPVAGYDPQNYSVTLYRIIGGQTLNFESGYSETGYLYGLSAGSQYRVTIAHTDATLPAGLYLSGHGNVTNITGGGNHKG